MSDDLESGGLIPNGPGTDYSVAGSRGAAAIEAQHRAALEDARESGRALIALPNGEFGFLDENEEFIGDHEFFADMHKSLFADATKLLSDPKPGCMYVWAAKYSPRGDKANALTLAQIRAGRYRPVEVDELDANTDLPIEKHTIGGYECAGIVDVVLMEVSPEAQKRMYRWREYDAKRKTNRFAAFEQLKERVADVSGGRAFAEHEIKH